MFKFFISNNLISPNQSSFKLGDSCINQLLLITHEIYKSFDDGLEVRGIFLDISKAFEKVWHFSQIEAKWHCWWTIANFICFLSNRKQRVVLNGQNSSWTNVHVGVPQGCILRPLLFPVYINDSADDLSSNVRPFPDDTSLLSVVHDVNKCSFKRIKWWLEKD